MTKKKAWQRAEPYVEHARKRDRAKKRAHNRNLMRVKQAPFIPKTKQKQLGEEDKK